MSRLALRFSTALILTASFTVVTSVLVLGQNLQKILTLWGESLQMTVYLSENVSDQMAEQLGRSLKGNDKVDKVEFISNEKALQVFKEQMASYAPDLLGDSELMKVIPSSYQFSLSSKITPDEQLSTMQELASSLKLQPGVDEVSYGQDWVKSYSHIMAAINWSGLIFTIVTLGGAVFVISNCIRSSVHQRREEIEVLELIGATSHYIRKPFLREGLLLCGASSLFGMLITFGLFEIAKGTMKSELSFLRLSQHIQFLRWETVSLILIFSLLLGWVATMVCLNSLNDGWSASRRQKSEI